MIGKKKQMHKATFYGFCGLALVGSFVVTNISVNQQISKQTTQQNNVETSLPNFANQTNLTFKVRSNPTNGFNGLTTPDGKYTYVLITSNQATGSENVGGSNSGIACFDTQTGRAIGEWYLPQWVDFELNYTTNIVFGQKLGEVKQPDGSTKTQTVFDPSQLFILCGISNLAKAISTVYDNYKDTWINDDPAAGGASHAKITFQPKLNKAPTIKIFKLNVTFDANKATYTNALGKNSFGADKFYNFVYPSDGTTGYAGFNANGVPYDTQAMQAYDTPDHQHSSPGYVSTDINRSLYYASGLDFSINRRTPISKNGPYFGENIGSEINNVTAGAFGSYLTYLTYGQNFAYHLGQKYTNSDNTVNDQWSNHDEFIMTSSFVNVDQNIGGLYSALISNGDIEDVPGSQDIIDVSINNQVNWPVPFGYQWLLADIANNNKQQAIDEAQTPGSQTSIQYSYIDATGNKKDVKWGDDLALTAPFINFLNDSIFLEINMLPGKGRQISDSYLLGSLFSAISFLGFGANWGATTGYIIYAPSAAVLPNGENNFDPSKNEYRYYNISAIAMRPTNEVNSQILYANGSDQTYSSFIFTNLIATDNLAPDGSLSYLINVIYMVNGSYVEKYVFEKYIAGKQYPNMYMKAIVDRIKVYPFSTFFTSVYSTVFCYDWESISNDNKENALIQPLAITDKTTFGYRNNFFYPSLLLPEADVTHLKSSFSNWNLVFLGGPSGFGIAQMDSSFTTSSEYLENDLELFRVFGFGSEDYNAKFVNNVSRSQISFLRRKISFVIHPYNGFVYFTAGTSINWSPGLSFWDVRSFDFADLTHNQKNTGTIYLNKTYLGTKAVFLTAFKNSDLSVWDIKEITQPYGNGGPTLAFITSSGIYTVSGAKTDKDNHKPKDFYLGSVNNLLAESGIEIDIGKPYLSYNENLISAVSFTPFSTDLSVDELISGRDAPNVMIFNHNYLDVIDGSKEEIYQAQDNVDYLVLADNSANPRIPGVIFDATKVPESLQQTPAAKPLLNVDYSAINSSYIHPNLVNPDKSEEKLTFQQIINMSLSDLYQNILQLNLNNPNYLIDTKYNPDQFGKVVFQGTNDHGSDIVNTAQILIPVTYPKFAPYTDISYYAPIKTGNNFSSYYDLAGLQSKTFAQVLIILNSNEAMRAYLDENKITANDLYIRYGESYDPKLAEEFNSNFVDTTDTDAYIHQHLEFFGNDFTYWIKPEISPLNNTVIALKVLYKFSKDQDWVKNKNGKPIYGYLCTVDDYKNGDTNNFNNSYFLNGYLQTAKPLNNALTIILVVVAVIGVVVVITGLGIGIPMRKQRKIEFLQSKIMNKRISQLSGTVSSSIKEVIQSTEKIDKKVSKLDKSSNAKNHPEHVPTSPKQSKKSSNKV